MDNDSKSDGADDYGCEVSNASPPYAAVRRFPGGSDGMIATGGSLIAATPPRAYCCTAVPLLAFTAVTAYVVVQTGNAGTR